MEIAVFHYLIFHLRGWLAVVAEALEEFASANVPAIAGKKWRLSLLSETSGTHNNCVPLLLSRG
jgi:hypothetical protein